MESQSSLPITNGAPSVFEIVFDGGSLGNPGKGYGSYDITSNENPYHKALEIQYGDNITNNQAEYQTLIEALTWLRQHLGDQAKHATVTVHGDSKLVIMQSLGKWKVNNAGLRPLNQQVRELMTSFASVSLQWHARAKSVARLGH